jgi:hypothetical protein
MGLKRDPETGMVFIEYFDPKTKKLYYDDPDHGKMRKAERDFKEEEIREEFVRHWKVHGPPPSIINIPLDGPPPEIFEIGFRKSLLSRDPDANTHTHCQNDRNRSGLWVDEAGNKIKNLTNPQAPFLNRLAHLCVQANIRDCRNAECLKRRQEVEDAVPQCDWAPFREWTMVLISCQAAIPPEQRATRPFFHLSAAANICHWLLLEYKHRAKPLTRDLLVGKGRRLPIDLFNVIEVIYWMLVVQAELGRNTVIGAAWGPDFLPKELTGPAARQAAGNARKLGLCQNRFWNLALVSERKEADLPGLMESAKKYKKLKHNGHEACSASFCSDTALDTTKLEQCHKCKPKNCGPLEFKPKLLNESIQAGGGTVWTLSAPFQVSQSKEFVAISHVWADGTGIGLRPPGLVNECVFNFLKDHIVALGCNAIWWDTISIPTDDDMRRKAINGMHHNYSEAKYTLLHDNYLLDFPWADNGSPCLALVFSPWLTRGWTALELIMSKKVKVLFKGENGPVIKDLDDDILAHDPRVCTRAHWIASTIIRRLRRPIESVTDLLAVLKPRNTSWKRDLLIIAGLLVGLEDLDYKKRQHEVTQAIINKAYKIESSSLLHGQVTMVDSGGWSWCPTSFYDLTSNSLGDFRREGDESQVGDPMCLVDINGVIAGHWYHRFLEKEDVTMNRVIPNSPHLSVILRIQDALRHWRNCMLLRYDWRDTNVPGLLVVTVDDDDEEFIHCRYVGSVFEFTPPHSGDVESVWRHGYSAFKIGADQGKSAAPARNFHDPDASRSRWEYENSLIKSPKPPKSSIVAAEMMPDYNWLRGKLWMGDQRFNGQLLVVKVPQSTGEIEAFSLQIVENPVTPQPYSMGSARMVISVNPEVTLGEMLEFRVDPETGNVSNGTGHSQTLKRVRVSSSSWPPPTIPADERTKVMAYENHLQRPPNFSNTLFRLEDGETTNTFAAIDQNLFSLDDRRPYKGIWTGMCPIYPSIKFNLMSVLVHTGTYPGYGCEFILFHQPDESRLEAVKLTGDRKVPRGAISFMVEDLNTSTRIAEESEWPEASVVAARVQIAAEGFLNR